MRCSIAQPTLVKKQELSVKQEEEADLLRVKLNRIYGEIQVLSDYCDKLDPSSTDFNNLKQLALIKREKYKTEFREILGKLQDKQFSSQVVTSDEVSCIDELNLVKLFVKHCSASVCQGRRDGREGSLKTSLTFKIILDDL